MDLDIATATAVDLTQAIRARAISSRELLEYLLARAELHNPALNAIVAFDSDRARASADAADNATASGEPTGPLHGLPMTVKDVFETEGLVTTSGAPELAHYVPHTDALAVARLKQAGAIIFGKSNTPMYAGDWQTYNDVYGRTSNPWDTSRTAAGSSGGAAAAVAAGLTPLEFGSDIWRLDPQSLALQRRLRAQTILGDRSGSRAHPGPARQPGRGRYRRGRPDRAQRCGPADRASRHGRPTARERRCLAARA
jgi:Amidase